MAAAAELLFADAQAAYEAALALREGLLGPAHADALATKHNLAELLIARGDDLAAAVLQQQILDTLGVSENDGGGDDSSGPMPTAKKLPVNG